MPAYAVRAPDSFDRTCLRRRVATAHASAVSRQPSAVSSDTSLQPRMLALTIVLTWRPACSRALVHGNDARTRGTGQLL